MVLAYHKHEKAYVLRWTVRPGSSRCPGEKTPQVVSKDADAKTITADMFWASPVVRCRLLCFSDTSPGALEHACAMGPRGGRSFAPWAVGHRPDNGHIPICPEPGEGVVRPGLLLRNQRWRMLGTRWDRWSVWKKSFGCAQRLPRHVSFDVLLRLSLVFCPRLGKHEHQWSRGRRHRCHRCGPGSIPG